MGRVTRKKAAELAEQLHIDEDAVLDMSTEDAALKAKMATPEHAGRSPLGELAPNSAESNNVVDTEPVEALKKSTKGRKMGKKGDAKGSKGVLHEETSAQDRATTITPSTSDYAVSPAGEQVPENIVDTQDEVPYINQTLLETSQSAPCAAVRWTRSQMAKEVEEERGPQNTQNREPQTPAEQQKAANTSAIEVPETIKTAATADATTIDAPASPLPAAVPNIIRTLRSETPGKRSTSNKENVVPESEGENAASRMAESSAYDALEEAVTAVATPHRVEGSPRPEDQIAALDELEDAVESVNRDIPNVQATPVKARASKEAQSAHNAESLPEPEPELKSPGSQDKKPEAKKESRKAPPVVRTTKAAQARISMAHNKDLLVKAPAGGRPRPSTTLGRSSSVRQSLAPKASEASKRVSSNPAATMAARPKPSEDNVPGEKKETIIPHSKPRPISLSFPTPPPPPKSTRPATQSTFQLPGEAVAAKLKAAREARMAKEAEDAAKKEKKVAFKARPAPKMASGDVPNVRQTNASRARESIISGKPVPAVSTHKRSNTVANPERPRVPSSSRASLQAGSATAAASSKAPRPSTSLATITKSRTSAVQPSSSAAPTQQRPASNGTARGKEVFARAAQAKAAEEKAKADKEAAAKKARADAAERGRVASREWAEKQRLRKLGVKPKPAVSEKAGIGAGDAQMEGIVDAVPEAASDQTAATTSPVVEVADVDT